MVLRYSATHPWDYSTGVQKDLNPYSLPDISDFRIPEFKNYLINLNNSDSWEFWNVKGIPSNAAFAWFSVNEFLGLNRWNAYIHTNEIQYVLSSQNLVFQNAQKIW